MHSMNRVGLGVIATVLTLGPAAAIGDVVAVVSVKSPVLALSKSQVVAIFLGKTARFPDGSEAVPIDQAEGAVPRDEFYARFAGISAAQLKAHWSKAIFTGRGRPPRAVSNSVETIKLLTQNPNAIGYIEPGMVDGSVRVLLKQ